MDPKLKPYLAWSAALHAVLLVVIMFVVPRASSAPNQIYRIQIIGATPGIVNRAKKPTKKRKARRPRKKRSLPKPRRMLDQDDFTKSKTSLPKARNFDDPLPTPREEPKVEEAVDEEDVEAPDQGPGADVAPEMDNFPYPWYITRVRSAIWNRWTMKMPERGDCGVMFTILRDGSVIDLRIEFSSGDSAFDYTALNAVRDAGPFGPLPPQFKDKFLKVHVQLRAGKR
jgi:TonB family protein